MPASMLLATSPQLTGIGGRYFEDCNEAPVVHDSSGWIEGVAPWALDPTIAERLWTVCPAGSTAFDQVLPAAVSAL
jgi:hypothetical protein